MGYHEAGADSGGLCPSEMSDRELDILCGIESHFRNIPKRPSQPSEKVWQVAEARHARVVLLDGDRGSGKTSLMLTMVERWNAPTYEQKGLAARYRERAKQFSSEAEQRQMLEHPPKNVRVLSILDFDPLPPSMPVVAGLVQAWRRLSAELDRGIEREGTDTGDESVLDSWQNLFRTAATGWGELSARKSLIDQVLDQEEQIQDWDTLGLEWQKFIDKVISTGKQLPKSDAYHINQNTVFVIMIDDCDLQVARMREILPAIRLLYDQNVFFIVSADRKHMLDMLELDYLGQQNQLSNRQMREDPLLDNGRWARSLAEASFEKVFPTRHRHRLSRLSLSEILRFPSGNSQEGSSAKPFGKLFESWPWDADAAKAEFRTDLLPGTDMPLSGYLRQMSRGIEQLDLRFPVATYRTAKQSWDRVQDLEDSGSEMVAEGVARLIGGPDYEDLISRPSAREEGREGENDGLREADTSAAVNASATTTAKTTPPRIVFNQQGTLTARYNEQLVVQGGLDSKLSLSASPAFGLIIPQSSTRAKRELGMGAGGEFSPQQAQTMLAVSLRDDFYHVDAPGMDWEMVRALAWTTHQRPHVMQFNWPLLIHPSPLRLILWSNEWRLAINSIRQRQSRQLSVAHAWLSHQLKWTGAIDDLPVMLEPEKFRANDFDALLENPYLGWRQRVVPLLARPEIGLPVELQKHLLDHADIGQNAETLRQERRRLITDALLAGQPLDSANHLVEDEAGVTRIIAGFENQHMALHGHPSPWAERLEMGNSETPSTR